MRLPSRIPTILGIFLLMALISGFVVLFERLSRGDSAAAGNPTPQNVQFTNVSDSGFTVTWLTQNPATGAILVRGTKQKTKTVFDERDTTGTLKKYIAHSTSFRDASADTEYEVNVLSNGKEYLDGGKPYRISSAPVLAGDGTGLEPAYGSIVSQDNQPATGALAFVTIEGAQTLSTLVSSSGSWLVPLNLVRRTDLSQYLATKERMTESINVQLNGQETSAITDTLNDAPVPTMVLGKTYDFRKLQAANRASAPKVLGTSSQNQPQGVVTLVQPAQGASLATYLPLVQGTGIPGKSVVVTIGITNPLTGTTTVGGDGLWRFTPPQPLTAGRQSVTVTTPDESGTPIATTHIFEVLKSGTQVLGVATPSATPTLEATPTATPTAQPIPTSGTTLPTILLFIIALGLLSSGAVIFVR